MNRGLALLFALSSLAGCGGDEFYFGDSVDLSFDFIDVPIIEDQDSIHGPYVEGADMRVWAHARGRDDRMDGWTLQSTDPAVFTIDNVTLDDDGFLDGDAVAVAAGEADIELVDDDGEVRDSFPIDVRVPTRFELAASGPLFVADEELAAAERPLVLAGGESTYQVRWFDGETELNGNGVLTALSLDGGVDLLPEQTYLFEDREWLHVTPRDVGAHTIEISANGTTVGSFEVEGVDAAAVATVELIAEPGADSLEEEQWTVVLAQPFDAAGEPIFGVAFTWDLDGVEQTGEGDLFRFTFDPDADVQLGATFQAVGASMVAHVGEDSYVDSSNNVGCDHLGQSLGTLTACTSALLVLRRRK